jgi:hypothetical protein
VTRKDSSSTDIVRLLRRPIAAARAHGPTSQLLLSSMPCGQRVDRGQSEARGDGAERKRREAEREEREAERLRRAERDYQLAIAAGGDVAAEAKWQRLYDETLDATASRYGLCQWDLANGQPGACTNRTANVFCAKHNRQLDRKAAARRRRKEAEAAHQSSAST